jgi:hypothetical protein
MGFLTRRFAIDTADGRTFFFYSKNAQTALDEVRRLRVAEPLIVRRSGYIDGHGRLVEEDPRDSGRFIEDKRVGA